MSLKHHQNPKLDAPLVPDIELAILPDGAQTPLSLLHTKLSDPYLVAFSTPDPTDPKDWPNRTK